jgi:hypothetical protein
VRKPSQTIRRHREDLFLGCAAFGRHVVSHPATVALGCVKRGMRHMRRASLSGALRVSCLPGALRVTDVSWCALAMAEYMVVGSRPRYSCAGVRTPAQSCRCSQHVRGNGEAGALVFRRRGMSAAGGGRFGAIVS